MKRFRPHSALLGVRIVMRALLAALVFSTTSNSASSQTKAKCDVEDYRIVKDAILLRCNGQASDKNLTIILRSIVDSRPDQELVVSKDNFAPLMMSRSTPGKRPKASPKLASPTSQPKEAVQKEFLVTIPFTSSVRPGLMDSSGLPLEFRIIDVTRAISDYSIQRNPRPEAALVGGKTDKDKDKAGQGSVIAPVDLPRCGWSKHAVVIQSKILHATTSPGGTIRYSVTPKDQPDGRTKNYSVRPLIDLQKGSEVENFAFHRTSNGLRASFRR